MSKKGDLSSALLEVSGRAPMNKPPVASESPTTRSVAKTAPAPSREGKKAIAGFFDPAVSRQLKQLGLDRETTVQHLLEEALNDLFEKYGKSKIA